MDLSFNRGLISLTIVTLVTLCNCVEWAGPTSTTAVEHQSTGPGPPLQPQKPALFRRETSALSICGYESGQAQLRIACNSGDYCDVSTLAAVPSAALVYGCCAATDSSGCLIHTSCVGYSAVVTSNPYDLTCPSYSPYCQSLTFPEVDGVAYSCGATSDSTWRTVSLTYLPATPTITSTSKSVAITTSSAPSGTPSPSTGAPPPSGAIQDLTSAEKSGIGIGCGCGAIIILVGIYFRCRSSRKSTSQHTQQEEKTPPNQEETPQEPKPITERIRYNTM